MISLGQQNGGPNVPKEFDRSVLRLRRHLTTLRAPDYAVDTPEFAFILRVDGSLTQFGVEGVEKPKGRKGYLQIDIVVTENKWNQPATAYPPYLTEKIAEAVVEIGSYLERKKRLKDKQRLIDGFALALEQFLADESA